MIEVLLVTLGYYGVIGIGVSFFMAQLALQRREQALEMLSPVEWVFGVVLLGLVWPATLAQLYDVHQNGPWKG